jgi:hypothetical protein
MKRMRDWTDLYGARPFAVSVGFIALEALLAVVFALVPLDPLPGDVVAIAASCAAAAMGFYDVMLMRSFTDFSAPWLIPRIAEPRGFASLVQVPRAAAHVALLVAVGWNLKLSLFVTGVIVSFFRTRASRTQYCLFLGLTLWPVVDFIATHVPPSERVWASALYLFAILGTAADLAPRHPGPPPQSVPHEGVFEHRGAQGTGRAGVLWSFRWVRPSRVPLVTALVACLATYVVARVSAPWGAMSGMMILPAVVLLPAALDADGALATATIIGRRDFGRRLRCGCFAAVAVLMAETAIGAVGGALLSDWNRTGEACLLALCFSLSCIPPLAVLMTLLAAVRQSMLRVALWTGVSAALTVALGMWLPRPEPILPIAIAAGGLALAPFASRLFRSVDLA